MSITREEVVRCYLDILGRKPESEDVISLHMQYKGTVWEFRQALLKSGEYRDRQRLIAKEFAGLQILPASAMVRENTDVWQCIEMLEGGTERLYLIDSDGRYLWRAMVRNHCRLETDGHGGWNLSKESFAPVIFEKPLAGHEKELLGLVRTRLASHPQEDEVLVVDSGGGSCMYSAHASKAG